ncbi:Tyrosine-protein kinase YwqD [Nocardioides aquaticus]|uniref:Tyrosine-protein kinase YwqD n=3 Tax=Actinomycetes TaxID=1760 RepID=A0ABX8EFL2_9ACTN|nr:polysaccharide biosynthesis tyrosine autokinase [Nocardioides aquaticus]QVT78436.1 Tyrosine-protein kinase YwqD [Nocardioides aquaticus]
MELKDYWLTIRRRWVLVLLTFVVVLGGTAAFTALTTPLYSSQVSLYVGAQSRDISSAATGGQFTSQQIASYAEIAAQTSTAEQVADALGGQVDAETIAREVEATVSPETTNLVLTVTDPDPTQARDIAAAYGTVVSNQVEALETPVGRDTPIVAVTVTQSADVNTTPVSPNIVRNLGLGAVLGLLLGIGLAVLRDLLDTSVSSVEDVQQVTAAPILGHINSDAAAVKKDPEVALREPTPWAEAFRVLRTNMQFVEVDHDKRMFVISSPLPGEGKSTTTVNLAITLAAAGQSVALVDCDLRRPMLATRLGVDGAVGTTSVLIGQVKLDDALQTLEGSGVQVLASGPVPPNPSELLQSQAMAELVTDLRERFDIVLLDAPPLLPVTDSALLAAQVDGLLLVTRHGKTTRDQLAHALDRLAQVDAKPVGVVINMAPAKKSARGYGYGYGYGYGPQQPGQEPSRSDARKERRAAARAASTRGKRIKA